MGRRGGIRSRLELRAENEAYEARRNQEDEDQTEEEELDEEEEEEEESEEEAEAEEEEDEEAPRKKKLAKAKPKSRSRTAKTPRQRVVWGVFNNSSQQVATFEYPRRKEAEELAAKLTADKRSTHFVQPVKEAIPETK